jgi:hypothetical protein
VRPLNVLLALVVSALTVVVAFELGLRLIPAFRPQPTLNRFDPTLGWSKTPGRKVARTVAGRRIEFEIDAHGLRDEVSLAKPPGTFRVMALGDSFVLGYTVARERAFADLLERRWKAEGRSVEVVNAGTEGWSTDQEALWFHERGRDFSPDLVLLFAYENDVYWCGQTAYGRFPKPRFDGDGRLEPRTLVDPGPPPRLERLALSKLARWLGGLLGRAQAPGEFVVEHAGGESRIAGEFGPLLLAPPAPVAAAVADAERRLESALIALRRSCESAGARLVVVPIPSKSAIHPEEREFFGAWEDGLDGLPGDAWSPDRPVETFLRLAAAHGIATVDPRGRLREMGRSQPLYFEKDVEWHLDDAGNQALADVVHDELDRLALFPENQRAQRVVAPGELAAAPPHRRARWPYVFAFLWVGLSAMYMGTYSDERDWRAPLRVGALLAAVFAIVVGGGKLIALVPPAYSGWVLAAFVALVLGFVLFKLGRRLATVLELLQTFVERGHWYLMPLLVVLLTVGSLLVVAASSPLIAPFIYTLF